MKKILFFIISALLITVNSWGQGTAANIPNQKLETPLFYFDNPDGTIETFPEYVIPGLEKRMMSISSSKYANPLKNEADPNLNEWIQLFFGRKTRTAVFVFDTKESAKGGMMTATVYSSTLLGLWGALWEGMRDKVGKALDEALPGKVTKKGSYKDYITQEKPEELMFNGHEAGHIVWKMDMSNSWLGLLAASDISMVFDLYSYYDEEFDKIVCVLFTYSDIKEPETKGGKVAAGVMKVFSSVTGYYDEKSGNTKLANMFEHQDMIKYFKEHFHLKKIEKRIETDIEKHIGDPPPPCVAEFVGTPQKPKLKLCDIIINIRLRQLPQDSIPEDKPDKPKPPVKPKPIQPVIPGPPGTPGPKKYGDSPATGKIGVVQQEESIERELEEDDNFVYMLQDAYGSKNAVIAVDKNTGNVFEAVPTKVKKDRPTIYSIGAHGDNLYLDVDGVGIIRYDGKSIDSSEKLVQDPDFKPGWTGSPFKRIIFSPNGRYMAYVGTRAKVYDLENKNECIKSTYECGGTSQVLTDDGDLFSVDVYRILVARNNGNKDEGVSSEAMVNDITGGSPCQLHLVGNEVYITGGKKLMKTDMKKFDWQLVSTMPGTEKYKISEISKTGNGFAVTDAGGSFNVHASFSASGSTPVLMKKIQTNLKNQFRQDIDTHNVTSLHYDQMGNLWLQYSDAGYVIYNTAGIKGLSKIAGKFVLYK